MSTNVFEYKDYRTYLSKILKERGKKLQLSQAAGFQSAFLSRVLTGLADLSLEQSLKISTYLSHTAEEKDYFLLLVLKEKAGSSDLKKYYEKKVEDAQAAHDRVANGLLKTNPVLAEKDQATFYSSWIYPTICLLAGIKGFQTRKAIQQKLGPQAGDLTRSIDFLVNSGLIIEKNGQLSVGKTHTHINKDSPLSLINQQIWRLKASSSIESRLDQSFYFTGVYSITKRNFEKVKAKLFEMTLEMNAISSEPDEEMVACLLIDFFEP